MPVLDRLLSIKPLNKNSSKIDGNKHTEIITNITFMGVLDGNVGVEIVKPKPFKKPTKYSFNLESPNINPKPIKRLAISGFKLKLLDIESAT